MIATCQFCRQAIEVSELAARSEAEAAALSFGNYQRLAIAVNNHMCERHGGEPVALEILGMMSAAGGAIAMQYVSVGSRVEGHRLQMAELLRESLNTAPVGPVDTPVQLIYSEVRPAAG